MKLLIFDAENKDNWGDLQASLSSAVVWALKNLTQGWVIALARMDSDECKKILAMKQKPTNSQRGYYWHIVIPAIRKAAAERGQHFKSDADLHSVIKNELMLSHSLYEEKINPFSGEIYKECFSISDEKGSKANTIKFIETVKFWAGEYFNIEIPEANNKKEV